MEGKSREDLMLKIWCQRGCDIKSHFGHKITVEILFCNLKKGRTIISKKTQKEIVWVTVLWFLFSHTNTSTVTYGTSYTDNCSNFVLTAGHTEYVHKMWECFTFYTQPVNIN